MDTNLDSFFMFFVVESVRLGRFSDESMRRAIQMIKVLFRGQKLEEVDRTKEDKKKEIKQMLEQSKYKNIN